MSGNVIWGYFSTSLNQSGKTFVANAGIFGKVYFPRIIVPISISITALFQFFIQFVIFLGFLFYYIYSGSNINPTVTIIFTPLIVLHAGVLSIGVGLIISAATAKYRDLSFAMGFLIQLWMYISPIVYPLSEVPERYKIFILINPMTAVIESFRGSFLGVSSVSFEAILISVITTILLFITGLVIFTRVEKTFMDSV